MTTNKKHLFLTLPLLVSAVSFGALNQSLAAVYDAKTDWTIHSSEGEDYCSASQGFSDKAYVTFAQRNDGSLSLAVDFQKTIFNAGETHKFKVKSGNVSRSFTVEPTSGKAVVFPLGDDAAFFSELSGTKILSLTVLENEYNFSLRDVDGLIGDLGACVAKLDSVTKTPKEVKVSEADKLKAENSRLSNLLKNQRRMADAKLSSVTSHAPSEEARERAFILEKENTSLKEQLAGLSKLKADLESVSVLQDKFSALEIEKGALQENLASANSQILELESNSVVADDSKVDVSLLDGMKLDLSTQTDLVASLQKEKQMLSSELSSAKETLSLVRNEKKLDTDAESQAVVSLQTQLSEANQRLLDLKAALDLSKKEIVRLESSPNNENPDLAALKAQRDALQADLVSRNTLLSDQSTAIDTLKAEIATLSESTGSDLAPITNTVDTKLVETLKSDNENKDTVISALGQEKISLEAKIQEHMAMAKSGKKDDELENEEHKFIERRYKTALLDLEAIKSENISLEDQLAILENEVLNLKSVEGQVALASDASWDLEKATRRYQESQREIVSLGRVIEQKNEQCDLEKENIENLLFDPEIADSAQRAKLSELEQALSEKTRIIVSLESQIKSRPEDIIVNSAPHVEIATLKNSTLTPQIIEKVVPMEPSSSVIIEKVSSQSYAEALIKKAGLSDIQEQEKSGMKIFRWKTEGLHGTMVEQALSGQTLSSAVNAYLDRAQSKCSGDFAAVPSTQTDGKQAYEIACVKPTGNGSSASLLFIKDNNNMITVAHEGRTEMMAKAIDARDAISKVAQN